MRLRIGSRGSQLALWQANHVAARLREKGHTVQVEVIHTTGDKITDRALTNVGGKGIFTKEIEEALADRRIDVAVHSFKDLPTELSQRFEIAAVPKREDARDALCSTKYSSIEELPRGARVGTSSLRREAQLRALRPDLQVHPLRGNVDTRLRKLEAGEYDAVVLAIAGLNRLAKTELVRQILPVALMCPAAGQGALAIEIRTGDSPLRQALAFLDDPATRAETDCERALLQKVGGGCQVPVGANAIFADAGLQDARLHLEALVASPDGSQLLRESATASDACTLGESVGERLLHRGGAAILKQVQGRLVPAPQQP